MDLPVHLAAGALLGSAVLHIDQKFPQVTLTRKHQFDVGLAVFLVGVLSHLILDAWPHYDWLFYIDIFKPLPMYWLIPQVIVSLPVLWFGYYYMRDRPMVAAIAMFGGMYPDIEKLMYFTFHVPKWMILFQQHSCYLTPWSAWERANEALLIVVEIWLMTGILAGIYWIAQRRNYRLCEQSLFVGIVERIHAYRNTI